MKFLVTASTSALSCLFLLVPAALGENVFYCQDMDYMSVEEADSFASQAVPDQIYQSDPVSRGDVVLEAYHFSRTNANNEPGFYLIQVVNEHRVLVLWKYLQKKWSPCPLLINEP